ncbi:MAG: hypothetical protein ACRER2_04080 [Methylococcales bacterium]
MQRLKLGWSRDQITLRLRDSGFLVSPAPEHLGFLHRGIFEYLAARHLAWQKSDGCGWVDEFLDKKAWDPNYQEVFVFLAGLLEDPQALLKNLADASKDDRFRHRLVLASQCLPEVDPSKVEICREFIAGQARVYLDSLLPKEIAGQWWPNSTNPESFARAVELLNASEPLGWRRFGAGFPTPTFLAEAGLGTDPDERVRRTAEYAGTALDVAVINPNILSALARLPGGKDDGINRAALGVFEAPNLPATTIGEKMILPLRESISDKRFNRIYVPPKNLADLVRRLVDSDPTVRIGMGKYIEDLHGSGTRIFHRHRFFNRFGSFWFSQSVANLSTFDRFRI